MSDLNTTWNQALALIEKELSKPSFETWLLPAKAVDFKNNIFFISVPNDFARDWLETRYKNLIKDTIRTVLNQPVEIKFIIPSNTPATASVDTSSKGKALPEENNNTLLNPKYTFDTFVVGNSNRFAHAASLAVAEAPAKAYNPLFIYGGVGLGKTHLMHAIGHYIQEQNPAAKILYVSSEKFTNELINSIRDDKPENFRLLYRNMDILLIDDIQFLAGKERTQEEFFHTFNALHEANKQIIISSDRPPKDIPTLEDRLRSRFEWGLITDIQPPDLETRIAILRKKAQLDNLDIPDDEVMTFIATKIMSNIRELEGALIRVMAYSSLSNREITTELAAEALKDILSDNKPKQIYISNIQQVVSDYYGLNLEDFKAKKRTRTVAFPRQIAMYLSREMTDHSLPKIGDEFGGRDHTTVIHAFEKIKTDLKENPQLVKILDELRIKIRNG